MGAVGEKMVWCSCHTTSYVGKGGDIFQFINVMGSERERENKRDKTKGKRGMRESVRETVKKRRVVMREGTRDGRV